MAETIKRLGAVTVGLNTDTSIYTCPVDTMAAISSINICNGHTSAVTFCLAHIDNGGLTDVSDEDYIAINELIPANSNLSMSLGIAMTAGDTLMVKGSANGTTLAFIAWGSEVT